MDAEIRESVYQIYRTADAEVAASNPKCDASGRCCRFSEFGHTLFLSNLEAEVLLETAPAYDAVSASGCPFQVDNLCTARAERPLGCRVYFCDPSFKDRMPEIMEKYLRQLKGVATASGRQWRYAALHEFLGEALSSRLPENQLRRPLPIV